jgi:YfiH family protein
MIAIVRSSILTEIGFAHGFSQKSSPPDVSRPAEPSVSSDQWLEASYQTMAQAVGYAAERLYEVDQVHGNAVVSVAPGQSVAAIRREKADALVAVYAPTTVGVRVADCLPLLLADPDSGAVAAVHAGWRGVVARVVPAAVQALCARAKAPPQRLAGAIFPHIRRCCFEVGEEVAQQLSRACADSGVIDTSGPRPHADLAAIVRAQLRQCGVLLARVDDVSGCTCCEPARFFSYRRERGSGYRHLAVIASRE